MTNTTRTPHRDQLDILIREKECELAQLRKERERFHLPRTILALISGDIIRIEIYGENGRSLRYALRLLMSKEDRLRCRISDGVRAVADFETVRTWSGTTTTIGWEDGSQLLGAPAELFRDEWTEVVKGVACG